MALQKTDTVLLETKRIVAKREFGEYLQKWGEVFQQRLGVPDEYILRQMLETDRDQIVNILSYQFSSNGGTTAPRIFQLSVVDCYRFFEIHVEHAIKTGLNYVIVNKFNHEICGVQYGFDECDQPDFLNLVTTAKWDLFDQLLEYVKSNDPIIKQFIYNNKKNMKHGYAFNATVTAINPNSVPSGIGPLWVLSDFICAQMNYTFRYSMCLHPITMYYAYKMVLFDSNYVSPKVFDFHQFRFNNGFTFEYYYNKLHSTYGYNNQYINKLKEQNKVVIVWADYTQIDLKDKYKSSWINVLNDYLNAVGLNGKAKL